MNKYSPDFFQAGCKYSPHPRMDTITHGIVGALVGKALFAGRDVPVSPGNTGGTPSAISSPTARVAIVSCTLGAMFPDIDVFAGPLARNPLAIMEWHRNITHSAVMLPAWSLVLAAVSLQLAQLVHWKAPPLWKLFLTYAVGIGTHIFLDVITNFGTMVWSPLRYSRVAWDWVFIVDFTLTGIALVPQLAAWCYRRPRSFQPRAIGIWLLLTGGAVGVYLLASAVGYGFPAWVAGVVSAILAGIIFLPRIGRAGFGWPRAAWCRVGFVLLCGYISLAAEAHHKALEDVKRFASAELTEAENIAALPLPPTLTHWVGLVSTRDGVWRVAFQEPSGEIESERDYHDAQSVRLIEEARKLRDVQVYLWFARYPVWSVSQGDGQETTVEITDVRFFREPDSATGDANPRAGFRRRGFTFQIIFDSQGRLVSHGFKEPE